MLDADPKDVHGPPRTPEHATTRMTAHRQRRKISHAGPGPAIAGPVRTCVGCRAPDAKEQLVRLVAAAGRIAPDPQARRPGRGAYVHRRRDCVERALGKGNLGRALRTRVDPAHTTALRQSLLTLLAPTTSGNLPAPGTPAEPGILTLSPEDLSTCTPASMPHTGQPTGLLGGQHTEQRTEPSSTAERMSRPNSENTSANPSPVASDRASNVLTRPAPPFVDEHRQARGQR